MTRITMLWSKYKDSEEDVRCFDSVSACAIYFAHEARRQYAEQGLKDDELFDAVVSDVALLFAGYDSTTYRDPEEVHGGDKNTCYRYEVRLCADVKAVVADVRDEDEMDRERRKEMKE